MQTKKSRSEYISVNGLRIHVRRWGTDSDRRLFMLHGWMDCSATFQFLVDCLEGQWDIVAPDWRGFGKSEWQNSPYWFPEYCADLDAILSIYSRDEPALIVGHSMGANVTNMVAGMQPDRVAKFVNLDAYGVTLLHDAAEYVEDLGHWIELRRKGPPAAKAYATVDEFARRLMRGNPRLTADRASFLANNFSRVNDRGLIEAAADPWHRVVSPMLVQGNDSQFWQRVTAPVLWLTGRESHLLELAESGKGDYELVHSKFQHLSRVVVDGASHNLHHEQPETVAPLIESFLG